MKYFNLPEYWIVSMDRHHPRWMEIISYINLTFGSDWAGDCMDYYGFDGESECGDELDDFQNNPTVFTVDEWFNLVEGVQLYEIY